MDGTGSGVVLVEVQGHIIQLYTTSQLRRRQTESQMRKDGEVERGKYNQEESHANSSSGSVRQFYSTLVNWEFHEGCFLFSGIDLETTQTG